MFLSHKSGVAVLLLCGLLFATPVFSQQPPATTPEIRISVERVNVGVVVTDSRGQFVGGLHREDFHVFDGGIEQPITDFLSVDEPAQVLLLVEAGPAVYLLEGGHLQALRTLLDGLSPSDRVAVARYNDAPQAILDFTLARNKLVALSALDQLQFNLGFGQLNLASSLSTALDWLARVPGKKSLILLSTGVDTSSSGAARNLLNRLSSTDVRVLAISLSGDLRMARPIERKSVKNGQAIPEKELAAEEGFAQADEELETIAEANGSRAYFPRTTKDYAQVFAEIAQLLRHEYNLGFIPPVRDGKIHSIEVRISGSPGAQSTSVASATTAAPGYRVSHRQGYVAPPPG